tara:strand:- start:146 stop:529 length:384 start_codon:yes stop_codon:yes gene_type:complete
MGSIRTNFRGYERNSFEDLGKQETVVDTSTPVGKVVQNKAMSMITSGDYEGVSNMLNVYKATSFKDSSQDNKPVAHSTCEVIIWDNNGVEQRTESDAACNLAKEAGWKFIGTCTRTFLTNGTFEDSK